MKISRKLCSISLVLVLIVSFLMIPVSAAENTVYGIGFVTASALRLRSTPDAASAIVATAQKNECIVVLSQNGDWYQVNYNLKEGYMHKDYLSVLTIENAELGYGKVNANAVNLRTGPGTSYSSVGTAPKDAKCYILGINQGWFKVIYNSNICYIRSDYLDLTEIPYENQASSNTPRFFRLGKSTGISPSAAALSGSTASNTEATNAVGTVTGQMILNKAKEYLGTPYVYGGASPSGFDCSGYVYYILKTLGYSPYRTPADQYSMGTYVSKANLQPGDIVFFAGTGSSNSISHVGIYAGGGQFVHSPNSRSVVSYADLTSGYWAQHYYGARRMN